MEEEKLEEQDSLNPDEETETSKNTEEETETSEKNEEVEELKKKAELADNYKTRAEKAEKEAKKLEAKLGAKEGDDLSATDIIALAKADLSDDQIAEAREWSKFKGITTKEAIESPALKAQWAQQDIDRRNAEAANIKGRTGDAKIDDEALKERAKKGDLPESDEEIAKLAEM